MFDANIEEYNVDIVNKITHYSFLEKLINKILFVK